MIPNDPLPRVLVIEDEAKIRKFLRAALEAHHYDFAEAATAKDGILQASLRPPDLVILDLGLPDMDGLEVTRRIREWSQVPILVLSARGDESDKVAALDAGADDYITKPFGVGELAARIRVALRHESQGKGGADGPVFEARGLRIDLASRQVQAAGRDVRLTPTEFRLLAFMAKHAGKVLTHQQMLTEVWGPTHANETQYLRVYMGQLRRKLETDPAQPRFLLTEPAIGYRLAVE
jgi:two-component system KDP operon response regulator KdpE